MTSPAEPIGSAESVDGADFDVAVVGAGPAGLAAAVHAAEQGAATVLLDAGGRLGGQYWRHSQAHPELDGHLHHDAATYRDLTGRLAELV
ncbi:MAG: FAD-dependent oxidoreductase, partial [Actinobacteria bacterium]|nr:FAD-dependent oxidoreductase [Actinomycetota bacterium]